VDDAAAGAVRSAGVLAAFDDRSALLTAVRDARARGVECLTAFAPAYDKEIVEMTARPSSTIGAAALAGAVAGCVAGFALTMWTTVQWPALRVGGKPLISIPAFVLIAFELTVLVASLAAAAAFVRRAVASRPARPDAYDCSFTDQRFGLLIGAEALPPDDAIDMVRAAGAVEWRLV
jgi:uncharacterized membrane protein